MTNEEREFAKSRIEYLLKVDDFLVKHDREALEMAIQALSQEPTDTWSIKDVADAFERHGLMKEQEPCDDAVSREAVIEWLENATYEDISYAVGTELSFLPSVTQKSGHWIKAKPWMIDNTSYKWECSECEKSERFRHNYCPNCGAKMESEDRTE